MCWLIIFLEGIENSQIDLFKQREKMYQLGSQDLNDKRTGNRNNSCTCLCICWLCAVYKELLIPEVLYW